MTRNPFASFTEPSYALLRIVAGLLFAFHGMQKIFGVMSEYVAPFGTQAWFGGIIELVAGLLIAIGLLTPWAAFLASGTMAVAYTQFHWKFGFGSDFFPVVNKGELALLYAFLFLYMACRGGGRWSLDAMLGRNRSEPSRAGIPNRDSRTAAKASRA